MIYSRNLAEQRAYPDRQSVAVVGDGGFAMLLAALTTAVTHDLPVKIILLKNNALAEVRFEPRELGKPNYSCELSPIDFVAFAKACAERFRCEKPEDVRPAIAAAAALKRLALFEAWRRPKRSPQTPTNSGRSERGASEKQWARLTK